MIKKLRKKFILINMFFVMTIMAVILSVMFISNYRSSKRNTDNFLEFTLSRIVDDHIGMGDGYGQNGDFNPKLIMGPGPQMSSGSSDVNKGKGRPNNILPGFSVVLDDSYRIIDEDYASTDYEGIDLQPIVDAAIASSGISAEGESDVPSTSMQTKVQGSLKNYNLRYILTQDTQYTYMSFADYSFEKNFIQRTAFICIAVFILSGLLFFVLSFFISKWALAPVEKAWISQTRFVADASHELKTPITVILANLGILKSHSHETIDSQSKWIDSTRDEAERMKDLISNLLQLAKSDSDNTPVEMTDIDLSNLAMDRVLNYEALTYENNIKLSSDIAPELHLQGHGGELKQLISILLDNACKYAGHGGQVDVRLSLSDSHIMLSVHNTGEAIPAEDLSHIFERFYRADKSRARKDGGYGLGLSIASEIVSHHHGKITVESSPADGTTFTVRF